VTTIIERSGPRSFRLGGSVDASNAANIADVLEPYYEAREDITIDLSDVDFMDSVGLGVLVTASKALSPSAKLVIENPQHTVARAIELAGLMEVPNLVVSRSEIPPGMIEEPLPPGSPG
jgi:anti-sigma B factor antagonist